MTPAMAGFRFLCSLLSPCLPPEKVDHLRRSVRQGAVPWEYVIATANAHLVTAAIWVNLQQKKLMPWIDPRIGEYLQSLHSLNVKRNQELKHQTLEAVGLLNAQGIIPLLFKGSAQLFDTIHSDPGTRIMTDIDMWVPEEKMGAAVDALTAVGYSDGGKVMKNYHHWAPLFRVGACAAIELHYTILPESICHVLTSAEVCGKAKSRSLQGVRFLLPARAHAILVGVLHSQVKDRLHYEYAISLKSMLDLVALMAGPGGHVAWPEIVRPMAVNSFSTVLASFLWSAHRLFDLRLPAGCRRSSRALIHHELCMAAIRWKAADRVVIKADRFRRRLLRRSGGLKYFPQPA